MKPFKEAIDGIRKAVMASEVREDIAESLEYVEGFASTATQKADEAASSAEAASESASTASAKAGEASASAEAAASAQTAASTAASTAAKDVKALLKGYADSALESKNAAAASQTAAKTSETESAKNLQGTREYFEQVRTIAIGAQGWYATPEALKTAVPVGENGWWAVVGTTDTIWTWDGDTGAWKDSAMSVDLSDYYTKAQADAKFGTPYTLPAATASTLGGVKVGSGLSVTEDGTLSSDAQGYTLPTATATTLGGVKVGSGLKVYRDGTIDVTSVNGFNIKAQTTDPGTGSALSTGTILLVYE